ncbi:uncharacterized protein METZ01_LOCUS268512, partial [marine metagenome]
MSFFLNPRLGNNFSAASTIGGGPAKYTLKPSKSSMSSITASVTRPVLILLTF